MSFFENTRKPQGFGGKLMTKMMNRGHAKLSQWGFSNISAKSDAEVLDVGCGGGHPLCGIQSNLSMVLNIKIFVISFSCKYCERKGCLILK